MDTKEQQVKRGIQSAKAEIDRRMAELLPKVMPNIIEQTRDADEPEKVRRVVLLKLLERVCKQAMQEMIINGEVSEEECQKVREMYL